MDTFNFVAGAVGIGSALFAVYIFMDAKKKEAVETQRVREYQQRLADMISMANAIAQQGVLTAAMADRDEVTKKELKHLIVSLLATVKGLQGSLSRAREQEIEWKFGIPSNYGAISTGNASKSNEGENGS